MGWLALSRGRGGGERELYFFLFSLARLLFPPCVYLSLLSLLLLFLSAFLLFSEPDTHKRLVDPFVDILWPGDYHIFLTLLSHHKSLR